ncbi:MAG: addiction module protein [candidate division NC10 bacterium]|nr:addiction module protein [candidate division NC10 bacterium]MDE2323037.1 addiction module protein [candidate division NC10 bacterium]
MDLTPYHATYLAYELTKCCPSDGIEKLAGALVDVQVDLNPHQAQAALFAFRSPFSKGAILADEVGLGKTIEAGLVSVIDERTFGDVQSFREQFAYLNNHAVFNTLKARLQPLCHRTLRRQVLPYGDRERVATACLTDDAVSDPVEAGISIPVRWVYFLLQACNNTRKIGTRFHEEEYTMSPKLLEIEREAIRLPVKDREAPAERLMRSVQRKPLTQVDEAWIKEAERRFSARR